MIEFKSVDLTQKEELNQYLRNCGERGTEYSLSNLFIWGYQQVAVFPNGLAFFSRFSGKSVYAFPLFRDNPKEILDAILADARERGISCRITCMLEPDCQLLEQLYPGQFQFESDRDGSDYIYDINDLAELKGKKFQRKRNHLNRFKQTHEGYTVEPITEDVIPEIQQLLDKWYTRHLEKNPDADICMEQVAIHKALRYRKELDMEGIFIRYEGEIIAMTMGGSLNDRCFDVQFEKATDEAAYVAINYEFARYLREKYPNLQYLDREEDMGIEGLRKAKLSYQPHHMVEKYWARIPETAL